MSNFRLPTGPLFPTWPNKEGEGASSANTPIPPCMPPEWVDEKTILGLFAPLDANSKNPIVIRNRDQKLLFWRQLILTSYRQHPSLAECDPVVSVSILTTILRRGIMVPMGIPQIIDDLVQQKLVVPVNEVLNPPTSTWWSKLMGYVTSARKETDPVYLLIPAAEERAKLVMQSIPSHLSLLPLTEFTRLTNSTNLALLVTYMPGVVVFEVRGVEVVKIVRNSSASPVVTDSDRALFHLAHSIKKLEEKEVKYTEQAIMLRQDVIKALKVENNRPKATLILKRTKLYESYLDKTMRSKDSLLRIQASIEEAQTSAEVFEAMKLGRAALKAENERVGDIDQVEALMDSVSELIQDTAEVSEAIAGQDLHSFSEKDFETELAELIAEAPLPASTMPTTATNPKLPETSPHMDALVEELEKLSVPLHSPETSSAPPQQVPQALS